jgi:hypothetical protein
MPSSNPSLAARASRRRSALRASQSTASLRCEHRVLYMVTLTCGCKWWEERAAGEPPPSTDAVMYCHASHHAAGRPQTGGSGSTQTGGVVIVNDGRAQTDSAVRVPNSAA